MAKVPPEKPAPGWKEFAVKYRDPLIVTVFALLWLACSCLPSWPHVFPQGKPARLAGPDAYFHLRHTEAVLEHYPVIERFDRMTNFPYGEVGLNQSFFDVAMATVVKFTGLAPVIVLAWISPLLMAATGIWCYFWLTRARSLALGFATTTPTVLTRGSATFPRGPFYRPHNCADPGGSLQQFVIRPLAPL